MDYVERERTKQEAWSFLRRNPETPLHVRVAVALRIVGTHFERSAEAATHYHPNFDRYARAYDAEQVFHLEPDVLPAYRTMYPREPSPYLPSGTTMWKVTHERVQRWVASIGT